MQRAFFSIFLILQLVELGKSFDQSYFVSPYQNQGTTMLGTIDAPYDNLLLALNSSRSYQSTLIYLLSGAQPHYLFLKELNPPPNVIYDDLRSFNWFANGVSNGNTLLELKSVTIRPLFCDDINNYPYNNSQYCSPRGQKLTVYVKTTEVTFLVRGDVSIQNVILDGVENIKLWNPSSTTLQNCLNTRMRCCNERQNTSSYNVLCGPTYKDYMGLSINPLMSLFLMDNLSVSGLNRVSLAFSNTTIKNFVNPELRSFVETGSYQFSLSFVNSQIDNIYFDRGFIYHASDSSVSNGSQISVQNTVFTNYNYWNMQKLATTRSEGYLFFTNNVFSGVLTIVGSTFNALTTSTRDKCWSQLQAHYNSPMNKYLSTDPRSRSDLWNQYHQDHLNRPLMSFLIYIKTLTGSISISSSTFKDIIGTSGSVLRVDEAPNSKTWFTIYNSKFDNNFAYDGFGNILIVQRSKAAFTRMLACPHVEVVGSEFLNTYGCPGSYGNIGIICYWNPTPPVKTSLSSYTIDNSAPSDYNDPNDPNTNLYDFWSQKEEKYAYIRIKSSTFQNNQLGVSNSLGIVGSYFTVLDGNTFLRNGGSSGDISMIRLNNSYFATRHPEQKPTDYSIHFAQSTSVYIDRIIRLISRGNTFDGNWGPWEGSLALASSITIKNWVIIKESIKSQNDVFINHNGLPSTINVTTPNDKIYTPPIVTISYDESGSIGIANLYQSLILGTNIVMDGAKFNNNTVNYDYTKFNYNTNQLNEIINNIMKNRMRFSTGLIKFLLNFEAEDIPSNAFSTDSPKSKIGFSLLNAQILNNTLLSSGCLFSSLWVESYILDNITITNNNIFKAAPVYVEANSINVPPLTQVLQSRHGLFCLSSQESLDSVTSIQINANKLKIIANRGVLFNLYPESSSSLLLTNSFFVNNTCEHSSIISLYDSAAFVSINNIFASNFNPLGNVFTASNVHYESFYDTYLKNNGIHASILLLNDALQYNSHNMMGKFYWNNISPKYKLFASGLAPQGGLYFISSCKLDVGFADFKENFAYSGIFTSFEATIRLFSSVFSNHSIEGTSVIGNFMFLSKLIMLNTSISDCSITTTTLVPVAQTALIILYTTDLEIENVQFIKGTAGEGSMLLYAMTTTSKIKSLTVNHFHRLEGGGTGLINLLSSKMNILTMNFLNTTSLFSMMSTELNISSAIVNDVKAISRSQFLFDMSTSTLKLEDFTYMANNDPGDTLPLIGGDNNYIQVVKAKMLNLGSNKPKIFDFRNSKFFMVTGSVIDFIEYSQTVVFDLTASDDIVITDSFFKGAGRVLHLAEPRGVEYISNNVIFAGGDLDIIKLENCKDNYIINNKFFGLQDLTKASLLQSQIQILNPQSLNKFFGNLFIGLYGLNGIIEIKSETSPYSVEFINNIFVDNKASEGGAIHLYASKLWSGTTLPNAKIDNSVFVLNNAVNVREKYGKGGAIYQSSPTQTKQLTYLANSYFLKNSADRIGGAIYFDYSPPQVDRNSFFSENYATRLNHIASYPVRLVQLDLKNPVNVTYVPSNPPEAFKTQSEQYFWDDIPSGPTAQQTFIFAVLDMYNQVVYDDDISLLDLYPAEFTRESRDLFTSKLTIKAEKGLYTYERFKFTFRVGKTTNLVFTSSAITSFDQSPVDGLVMIPTAQVNVKFRMCSLGEFIVVDSNSLSVCQPCEASFWQLTPNSTESSCQSCASSTTFCLGGNNVGPRPGYWRLNETADIVILCPLDGACKGNDVPGDAVGFILNPTGECEEGYQGNVCNNCIPGWAKSGNGECQDCKGNIWYYVLFFGILLVEVVLIGKEVKEVMELSESYQVNNILKVDTAVLIRILMNYFQLISVVGGINIIWPNFIGSVISLNSKFSAFTNQLLSIDCFVNLSITNIFNIMVFLRILIATTGPFLFIFLSWIFWTLYFLVSRTRIWKNKQYTGRIITTAIIICFTMQPIAISRSFSLFQCENLYKKDDPMYFLTSDYDVRCWEGIHKYWVLGLGIPSLFVWVFGLPLLMFFLLRKNRAKLNHENVAKKYAFMYIGYRKMKYYWEFVIMIRKILLIFGTVVASLHSVNLQIYFTVVLTIWAYVLQIRNQPYTDNKLNQLEGISLLSSEIVNFSGLYFQLIERSEYLDLVVAIMAVLGNAYFFISFGIHFFKLQILKLKQSKYYTTVMNFAEKKLCCFKKAKMWGELGVKNALKFSVKKKESPFIKSLQNKESSPSDDVTNQDQVLNSPINQNQGLLHGSTPEQKNKELETEKSLLESKRKILSLKNLMTPKDQENRTPRRIFLTEDSEKDGSGPEEDFDDVEVAERINNDGDASFGIKTPTLTPTAKKFLAHKKDSDNNFTTMFKKTENAE